ncbi:MAG: carboxymuconolactone decarboxylase family protein [Phycisphaerales bacterium]|nr:carboxymuconolactone decarboxylase family protein [Phycisphaerales bacterium]
MKSMKAQAPQIGNSFAAMFQGLMKEGALSVREKELIAVAIAVKDRCEPCIYSHVEKALKCGATSEQIMEAAGVAVVMGGGPSYVYAPLVVAALEHLQNAAPTPTA